MENWQEHTSAPAEVLAEISMHLMSGNFGEYGPTTWGPQAFIKSFDKFFYAEPVDFFSEYPQLCAFADWATYREFRYLEDTRVIHITATEKNTDSTPAYPKMNYFDTEEKYLESHGWAPM